MVGARWFMYLRERNEGRMGYEIFIRAAREQDNTI